jgi:hypothetical protein
MRLKATWLPAFITYSNNYQIKAAAYEKEV